MAFRTCSTGPRHWIWIRQTGHRPMGPFRILLQTLVRPPMRRRDHQRPQIADLVGQLDAAVCRTPTAHAPLASPYALASAAWYRPLPSAPGQRSHGRTRRWHPGPSLRRLRWCRADSQQPPLAGIRRMPKRHLRQMVDVRRRPGPFGDGEHAAGGRFDDQVLTWLQWIAVDLLWTPVTGAVLGAHAGRAAVGWCVVFLRSRYQQAVGFDAFLGLGLDRRRLGAALSIDASGFLAVLAAASPSGGSRSSLRRAKPRWAVRGRRGTSA